MSVLKAYRVDSSICQVWFLPLVNELTYVQKKELVKCKDILLFY